MCNLFTLSQIKSSVKFFIIEYKSLYIYFCYAYKMYKLALYTGKTKYIVFGGKHCVDRTYSRNINKTTLGKL